MINPMNFIFLSIFSLAVQAQTFQVNLQDFLKNNTAIDPLSLTDQQLKARSSTVKMKVAQFNSEWAKCADLRGGALKAHPAISGWIWTAALNCEQKAFEQDAKRIKKFTGAIDELSKNKTLLDQGAWSQELRNEWVRSLQTLLAQAKNTAEKKKWIDRLYMRPEWLTTATEQTLLQTLQDPFETTTRPSLPLAQKTVSSGTEPWWEAARKMDYENVVKILDEYFDQNKSPSNEPSARLFFAKANLWTGRYDQAKTQFLKVIEKFPLTDEGVEAQFRLGLLHLRLGNPQLAIEVFDQLIATSREKNPLTTKYWRARALFLAGQTEKFEKERDSILQFYPYTYFGLKLRMEMQNGVLQFPEAQTPVFRKTWVWPESVKPSWERFRHLVRQGWLWEATQEIQTFLAPQETGAYQMWAEFLSELKLDFLALQYAQTAQNRDERLSAWSFQKKFMPMPFQKQVMQASEKFNVEPWMIWSIMRQESAFNTKALSTSSAFGLMQMIGPTAQEVAADLKTTIVVPDELFSPVRNVTFGAYYLSKMRNNFDGHWPVAAAAYNAGPTRLKSWLKLRKDTEGLTLKKSTEWQDEIWIDEMPWNETQNYVKAVMRNFLLYRLGSQSSWAIPPVFWSESKPQESTSRRQLIDKKKLSR